MTNLEKARTVAAVAVVSAAAFSVGCGGGGQDAQSPDAEGPAERAGKKLDRAADKVHEKGDEIGQDVDEKFREGGKDVKETIGDDPHAPPPDPKPEDE